MTKLYIDTNILIYAIEDSKNPYGKDISSSSSKLFWESASCKYHVIISTWALAELKRIRNSENLNMLLKIVEKKIISDTTASIMPDYKNGKIHVLKRDSRKSISEWKKHLSDKEIQNIYYLTRDIADKYYSYDEWI